MKHSPIIQQCLERINEALESIDENGYVKIRVESAIMIYSWLERLDLQKKEQFKNAEKDQFKNVDRFLKNLQTIHGKEEGLRQYNEIMERENVKNISN